MLHTNNPIIKHKAGLLNLAEELGNVSRACKVMVLNSGKVRGKGQVLSGRVPQKAVRHTGGTAKRLGRMVGAV